MKRNVSNKHFGHFALLIFLNYILDIAPIDFSLGGVQLNHMFEKEEENG